MDTDKDIVNLGNSGIDISHLGIGAWAWGDLVYWGYGHGYSNDDINQAFDICVSSGVNFFDTAESYGLGKSEKILGKCISRSPEPVVIATKFMPYPWRLRKVNLIHALLNSLNRLSIKQVDLYQIHWPFPPLSIETWADGLAEAVKSGLAKAVGVSNYNIEQMQRAQSTLVKRGVFLSSNQVEFSLINREVEFNGLLKLCREINVTLVSYSPLAQGLLTGKYNENNLPPGIRGYRYSRKILAGIQPLIRKMREVGRNYNKTPTQVALNWLICKGSVPIPGVKNAKQAMEIVGALGWRLNPKDIQTLDRVSQEIF